MGTFSHHTSRGKDSAACLISVVMGVHNGERFLQQSVDSILAQSFGDYEFIIVDDGSTDGTAAILESYTDPRISVIHQSNRGLTEVLQTGLEVARGEYFARQDSDDISLPTRFEHQLDYLRSHPDVLAVGTSCVEIDEEGVLRRHLDHPLDDIGCKERLAISSPLPHGSVIVRMETLRELGGYRKQFTLAQDRDLWLRLSERGKLANLPEHLYLWRRSPEAIGESRRPEQREMSDFALDLAIQRLRHGVDDLGCQLAATNGKRVLARHQFYLGFGLLSKRGILLALRLMLGTLVADGSDPSRWYSLIWGVPVRIVRNTYESLLIRLSSMIRGTAHSQPSPGVKLPAPKRDA